MAHWIRLCAVPEAPSPGSVMEAQAGDIAICLANVEGRLAALDNWCPHRRGPLGQGWLEGEMVICPWHSWSFHTATGQAEYPVHEKVSVFPLKAEGDDLLIDLEGPAKEPFSVPSMEIEELGTLFE